MKKIFDLGKDRSAISAVLVIIVVAIVVVAAVAAYVVLSNEDEKKILAPGSTMVYDYEAAGEVLNDAMKAEIIGQNNVDYFIRGIISVPSIGMEQTIYDLQSKDNAVPEGMVKIGTERVNTIDGEKVLDVWEKTEGDTKITIYADSEIEYMVKYETDMGTSVFTYSFVLKSKELVYQKASAYKQSDDVGRKATYEYSIYGTTIRLVNECIADCIDDKFAVKQSVYLNGNPGSTESLYYMSETPYGVIIGATDTGTTRTVTTIDGQKTLNIWEYDQITSMVYYFVDSETDLIYLIREVSTLLTLELALTSYD